MREEILLPRGMREVMHLCESWLIECKVFVSSHLSHSVDRHQSPVELSDFFLFFWLKFVVDHRCRSFASSPFATVNNGSGVQTFSRKYIHKNAFTQPLIFSSFIETIHRESLSLYVYPISFLGSSSMSGLLYHKLRPLFI